MPPIPPLKVYNPPGYKYKHLTDAIRNDHALSIPVGHARLRVDVLKATHITDDQLINLWQLINQRRIAKRAFEHRKMKALDHLIESVQIALYHMRQSLTMDQQRAFQTLDRFDITDAYIMQLCQHFNPEISAWTQDLEQVLDQKPFAKLVEGLLKYKSR